MAAAYSWWLGTIAVDPRTLPWPLPLPPRIPVTVGATDWRPVAARVHTSTDQLARVLFADYVLPFEIVSVLLLAAVVGGVFLAKREEGGPS